MSPSTTCVTVRAAADGVVAGAAAAVDAGAPPVSTVAGGAVAAGRVVGAVDGAGLDAVLRAGAVGGTTVVDAMLVGTVEVVVDVNRAGVVGAVRVVRVVASVPAEAAGAVAAVSPSAAATAPITIATIVSPATATITNDRRRRRVGGCCSGRAGGQSDTVESLRDGERCRNRQLRERGSRMRCGHPGWEHPF
jgi:hypothetical protein